MRFSKIIINREKFYNLSIAILGMVVFGYSISFLDLVHRHGLNIGQFFVYGLVSFGFLTSILCFCSIKFNRLVFPVIILLSIFISAIGSFQQMNISILYIIPVFMAYFLSKRTMVFSVLYLDVILFNISRLIRGYNIYLQNPPGFSLKLIEISTFIVSILESGIFLAVVLPIFMLVIKQNLELKKSLLDKNNATNDILQFCSTATSFHNKYLSVHINGVRDITRAILDSLINDGVYIEKGYYEQIIFSVQFHDIGKIYIDSSILDKKGTLNSGEFELIKEHPSRGLELFNLLPKNVLDENYMSTCKNVIFQHHERLDGTGYPTGTKDISFEAKIVAIADVVDALLSWRPYKPPLQWEKMVNILEEQKSGFNYECIKAVYKEKEKILAISDKNNIALKNLLMLSGEDIQRC